MRAYNFIYIIFVNIGVIEIFHFGYFFLVYLPICVCLNSTRMKGSSFEQYYDLRIIKLHS